MDDNRLYQGDCVEGLGRLEAESVDLAFADPPFNIGYDYDVYQDRHGYRQYLDWSRSWGEALRYLTMVVAIMMLSDLVWRWIAPSNPVGFFRRLGRRSLAVYVAHVWVVAIIIEGQESQPWLEKFAQENSITIPLTVLRNGKDDIAMKVYKLNANINNTILMSVKREVAANLVNVHAENFKLLTNTISKVLDQR